MQSANAIDEGFMGPVLTRDVHELIRAGCTAGTGPVHCSLDLGRTEVEVMPASETWLYAGQAYPYLESCKERTIYY